MSCKNRNLQEILNQIYYSCYLRFSEEKQYTLIIGCCTKQYQTIPHKIHYQKQKVFILLIFFFTAIGYIIRKTDCDWDQKYIK